MAKVRKIDFSPDEFLAGVIGMTMAEGHTYWVLCSLIYSSSDWIAPTDERFRAIKSDPRSVQAALRSLIDRGKIEVRADGKMMVRRCGQELERASRRIQEAVESGSRGGRPRKQSEENQEVGKPNPFSAEKLSLTTTITTNSISPEKPGVSQVVVDFPGGEKQPGRRRKNQDREPEGFAEFYGAFPRKDDPDDAARVFGRVVRSGKATAAELLAAARAYAKDRAGQDPKFTKQMATWLNKGSYRNAPAAPQSRGGCPL